MQYIQHYSLFKYFKNDRNMGGTGIYHRGSNFNQDQQVLDQANYKSN